MCHASHHAKAGWWRGIPKQHRPSMPRAEPEGRSFLKMPLNVEYPQYLHAAAGIAGTPYGYRVLFSTIFKK